MVVEMVKWMMMIVLVVMERLIKGVGDSGNGLVDGDSSDVNGGGVDVGEVDKGCW